MKKKLALSAILFILGTAIEAGSASFVDVSTRPKWVPNEIVVKFKQGISDERISRINQRHGTSLIYTSPFAGFKRLQIPPGKTARQAAELYQTEPDVQYAELNYYAYAFFAPNDPYYSLQWNFYEPDAGINIEPAWDITTGDPNIIIAVVDTGVAYENYQGFQKAPDLINTHFVAGYDFVNDDAHPNDDDGHGTHVTGTIAQSTNNNLGTAGIAFNCSIMPVKVLNRRGEAPYTTIADGVYFAANNGAKVINMSLGGPADSTTLRDAVAYAHGKGVTIVCAAGNEYQTGNPPSYPAAYDDYCIAVGATGFDRMRAYYSNTGSYVDVVAPGGDLNVDLNGDGYPDGILQQTFGSNPKDWGYYFYSGTSMAAPHVSAIAGLLLSTGVSDPNIIRNALQNTARDLGPAGRDDEYGWGLVDAFAALNYNTNPNPGDFTGDGLVNFDDFTIFADYWLTNESSVDIAPQPGGDGIVDFFDYAQFANSW